MVSKRVVMSVFHKAGLKDVMKVVTMVVMMVVMMAETKGV